MASATGLLNQTTCEWDQKTLSAVDIDESFLPPIVAPRRTAGGLRDEFMLRWPMLERAIWFQAIGDGAANNIGVGCVSRERVALTVGTSGAMRMLSSRPHRRLCRPNCFAIAPIASAS